MATGVKVFRSTDTGAPILTGSAGSMLQLLRACLVDGYGSTRATVTITSDGTTVANNDTITIDGTVYTWKTALTPAANEVLIGASAATNLSNLAAAIGDWGTRGTNYATGTVSQRNVQVTSLTSTVLTLTALKGGVGGNSIAISKSAAHISLGGATLSGGAGSDTTTGAGWTMPSGPTLNCAVFKQAGGTGFYLDVDDNAPNSTYLARRCEVRGYETSTGIKTGTNPFPTTAQFAAGSQMGWYKSTSVDSTARAWVVYVDDRTLYVFTYTGDQAGYAVGNSYGDIYSFKASDAYKNHITFTVINSNSDGSDPMFRDFQPGNVAGTAIAGAALARLYMARAATAVAGAVSQSRTTHTANSLQTTVDATNYGPQENLPNQGDVGFYVTTYEIADIVTALAARRGFLRGIWLPTSTGPWSIDGDTFSGTGAFAGKTFAVQFTNMGGNTRQCIVETSDTWETSS